MFLVFIFRELLDQHPENIRMIMTHTIYNELSNTKNPNNMAIITTLFQKNGEQSARVGIYRTRNLNTVQLISKHMYIHLCTFDTFS